MQTLSYQAARPFLDQTIVQVFGAGELPAGVKAHFRYLLPDNSGIPQLRAVFDEGVSKDSETKAVYHIHAERELSTAYNQLRILGDGDAFTIEVPAIFNSGGDGEVATT